MTGDKTYRETKMMGGYSPIKEGVRGFGQVISAPDSSLIDNGNSNPELSLEGFPYDADGGMADAGSLILSAVAKAGTTLANIAGLAFGRVAQALTE